MFDETISKLSALGASKARLLENNPAGFFIGSAMAGIYVGFGILLIFSLGSLLDPSIRPLVMGASFGLALILVVFAGAELYTGHTMNMTISTLEGQTTLGQLGRVWLMSWVGNLVGAMLWAGLFGRVHKRRPSGDEQIEGDDIPVRGEASEEVIRRLGVLTAEAVATRQQHRGRYPYRPLVRHEHGSRSAYGDAADCVLCGVWIPSRAVAR